MVRGPFNVKVVGIPTTKAYLKAKNTQADVLILAGLEEAGDFVKSEVKASINGERVEYKSYDTGAFYRSIEDKPSGKMTWMVYTDSPYGPWLEYGEDGTRLLRTGARNHFRSTSNRVIVPVNAIIKSHLKLL